MVRKSECKFTRHERLYKCKNFCHDVKQGPKMCALVCMDMNMREVTKKI